MSVVTNKPAHQQPLFNVPNQLTVSRLLLSIVLFVLIAFHYYLAGLVRVRRGRGHRLARRLSGPAATAR